MFGNQRKVLHHYKIVKTLSLVLSTFWAVARKTPTMLSLLWVLARCTPAILKYLPAALVLISKIRDAFGSEAVQEFMKALYTFIDQISSSAPIADGDTPDHPKQEQQRRLFRFRNRLTLAGIITDAEAQELCALHGTGFSINGSTAAGFQYA
jgi:hypothetical protein